MKREKKQIADKTRNENFAVALAYLQSMDKETYGTKAKQAEKIGIDQDTITNIEKCHVEVSNPTIIKLYVNTGRIFNLRFLLGQSGVMLAEDVKSEDNVLLAAKEEIIAGLKRELDGKDKTILAKDETIASQKRELETKNALIKNLQQTVAGLRTRLSMEKGLSTGRSRSESAEPQAAV